MLVINYPEPNFRIKTEDGKEYIFDSFRKKWLLLTPEEWVRQNFVQYLTQVMHYPASLVALEKEIWLGELKKRFDILVYRLYDIISAFPRNSWSLPMAIIALAGKKRRGSCLK